MATVFETSTRDALLSRIDRLRPDTRGIWGKMNVQQMVCHLTDALKVSLGEIEAPFRPGPLSSRFARWMIISVLPIPRGKARTKPAFQTSQPGEWTRDVALLKSKVHELGERGRNAGVSWPAHPTFGPLTRKQHGILIAKHMDHHLRQFGV
jgi:hypothetical protein